MQILFYISNQISMRKIELAIPKNKTSVVVLEKFLESCLNIHLLFQTQEQTKPQIMMDNLTPKISLIEHLFRQLSTSEKQSAQNENVKTYNNQTFFQTFNNTDVSLNNQENQYSKYLQEYETVIKASRRKQYVSPEKKDKEMKLLINQFLSDVSDVQEEFENSRPTQKTPLKTVANLIKVEKIDLTTFHGIKLHKVQQINIKEKKSIQSKQNNKSPQLVSKRLKTHQGKIRQKSQRTFNEKSKQKGKIEVKIIKKQEPCLVAPTVASPLKVKEHHIAKPFQPVVSLDFKINENQQMLSEGYCQNYLKKKTKNHEKTYAYSLHPTENMLPSKFKNGKKPLKIQIQLPLLQIQLQQKKKNDRVILEDEGTKIIQQISKAVSTLLKKTKNVDDH